MKSTIEIIETLNKILEEKEPAKMELVKRFQEEILTDDLIIDETIDEIVTDLAYDLDFYEPNKEWKKQDISFYGEERLEEIIKEGIGKIESYNQYTIKAETHE
jgi:hypothetical protein